jgi:aldehyde:ferredoxin oxidoreductase
MNGYHGRFLDVDLGAGTTRDLPLSEEDLKKYIGGATLAAALVYDRVSEGLDPLSPQNPLVLSTGPFTASPIPMVSRYVASGISPLTGHWGEATSGGTFPFRLKGSGFDGILITGRSEKPVYLYVKDGQAEIRDASQLWGKDSYETQRLIKDELGDTNLSVACIAEGGERQIRYASIMNDKGRSAGRCGMGALMGSKNLKAVAASGNSKTKVANAGEIRALAKKATSEINGNMISVAFREYGTLMYMDMGMMLGDVPVKYFTKSVFPVEKLTGEAFRQKYTFKNHACRGCPIGCGRLLKNFRPDLDVDGPEYETAAAFGPLCFNTDMDSIVEANHLCNVHGLDTISAGVSIAYAIYLYEQGVLTKERVGLELTWGDGQAILRLLEMIVRQEGFGRILGQGTLAMARELGRDEGEAAQVKGLEMPMHEGRAFHGLAVSYATGPRGACHLKGDYYNIDLGNLVAEYAILPGDRHSPDRKGEFAAKFQSLKDLFDALTLCKFAPLNPTMICDILNGITGWAYTSDDLLMTGDRSVNLKRGINSKLGLTREADRLPEICLRPLDEGTSADLVPDMDKMLREYYDHRSWVWETGQPSKEKLLELGLTQVAEDLYS